MSDQLTPLDATFLELEDADDAAHMHIGAVMVFGAPPGGDAPSLASLRSHLEARLHALPRYRQRLSSPHSRRLHQLRWEPDADFDIRYHVRRAVVCPPGGREQLLAWAADYWSQRLDRRRPLWEAVLVEGLAGDRWALCTKTHHALVDGVGSVDVGHLLLDSSPRRRLLQPTGAPHEEGADESHGLIPSFVAAGVRAGVDAAMHPSHLLAAVAEGKAMLELIVKDEVRAAPRTSINVPIGTRRRYEAVSTELARVKAVKNALGGTVNDVVLAAVTGGLRHLLRDRGDDLPEAGLRAMVPVNVRAAEERLRLGNRITSLFVHLPVAEPDPLRRYQLTVGEAETLKGGDQAKGGAALIRMAGLAPPVVHSLLARGLFASRLFNVTVTNVPGPQQFLYAFGSRMEEVLPLVPLAADHAVGIAVVSYAGRMTFGLNGDDRAIADLGVMRDGIRASLEELYDLAAGPDLAAAASGSPAAHS